LSGTAADPVLLLHGQPGGARDWDRVLAALDARLQAVPLDRPGWDGRSAPTDLDGNARAAVGNLDARGIARATVVGHSFGGAVAIWMAVVYPERVGALVLLAPAANVASLGRLDRWLATPVAGYGTGAAMLGGLGLALGGPHVRRRLARKLTLDDRYLCEAGRVLRAPASWRAFHVEQRALFRDLPALEARLDRISASTTIVSGSADQIVPLAAAERLAARIRGSRLIRLERAGHLLPMQHARRVAALVEAAAGP
jgi:pimeloyl-ACP methyl ester carboxylesterase